MTILKKWRTWCSPPSPPGDVHFILSEWSGASYPKLIEALALYLSLKEVRQAAIRKLTLEEMTMVRNVGTYTLQ